MTTGLADAFNYYGQDLVINAAGDLLMTNGLTYSEQRVYRRLLTNPGDYLWHLTYGAGLPAMIGNPQSIPKVNATINSQIFQEATVASSPAPVITTTQIPNGISTTVVYTESSSEVPITLAFSPTQ